MYSFTGNLITQPLIHNYRKSVPVSHQHQTSCSEMRTQETMQLRTACDKQFKRFSDECQLPIQYFKQSVHNLHQLQQHTTKACCKMMWLSYQWTPVANHSISSVKQSSARQCWSALAWRPISAFQHYTQLVIIHWHIQLVHLLLFLRQSRRLITCSLRKYIKFK